MVINHKDKTIEERLKESKKVFEKYPDRLCIYIEKSEKCKLVNNLEKNKYIIPNTISVAEFIVIIRKRINITSEQGIFFFVNNITISGNTLMLDIYNKHKAEDNFLYITYSGENCFGGK